MMRRIVPVAAVVIALTALSANAQLELLGKRNAVLEGIQLTSEPSGALGEKINSCYFIFREKPTNFFYEIDHKEGHLAFEFSDVVKGASPIGSAAYLPIKGFRVDQKRVNANADVKGLKPEWHDHVVVTLDMEAIPKDIAVTEEYSVISFSYKWCTDGSECKEYQWRPNTGRNILIASLAGVGGVAAAGVVIALLLEPEEEDEDLPINDKDLPQRIPY